jgi:molybdate transport repressor ModE-like protein
MSGDLEVRHCRVLLALQESGGIAAAARALGLAQSTVSETLLSLERMLGMPVILRRRGREAALTPAAEALLPHARAVVSASETALEVFARHSQGIIRLGAVESISSFLLPRPLSLFRLQWPRVDVRVAIGLCEDMRKRVARFELDAALSIEEEKLPSDGEVGWRRTLAPAQLRFVVSPLNPLAAEPVRRADLRSRTLLLADPDGAFNKLLQRWFRDEPEKPSFQSAGSIDGVKRGVQNSDAIGVLPAYAVAEELQSGALAGLEVREALPAIALQLTTLEPPPEASPLHDLIGHVGEAAREI